jgi:hypothetical protein
MSKFIDNLKRTCEGAPAPIGFLPRQAAVEPCRMQLLAIVAPENLDLAAEFFEGADAVLLPVGSENPTKKRLAAFAAATGKTPWGGWLKGKNAEIDEVVKAGCDFVILSGETSLATVTDEKTSKIIAVEPGIADTMLRAAGSLPVDAVLIDDESMAEGTLTWQNLIQFQRCSVLANKPMLAVIPAEAGAEELKLLWEAGVVGAVVDTEDLAPEKFKALRETINGTKFPLRGRRREKIDAVLPRLQREPAIADHEEGEEE